MIALTKPGHIQSNEEIRFTLWRSQTSRFIQAGNTLGDIAKQLDILRSSFHQKFWNNSGTTNPQATWNRIVLVNRHGQTVSTKKKHT